MAEPLIYQQQGDRAVLTLNRPERRNALSPDLVQALLDGLRRADADPDAKVVVITGTGDKAFCAGGDLGGGMMSQGVVPAHHMRAGFADLFRVMRDLGKPIVAKVQGDALGGGLGLACGCDLVIAAEEARFGTPEIRLGLFPWVILATILRNVPRKAALELILTGDKISAAKAVEIGLANRVVPRADLGAATDALVDSVARHSPAILELGRRGFYTMSELPMDGALEYANAMLSLNTLAEDAMEGVTAFMQRREPQWKGR